MPKKVKSKHLYARLLKLSDIPELLDLEKRQWSELQAADEESLRRRIIRHPNLSMGVFCLKTGEALASLFMIPFAESKLKFPLKWKNCSAIASQNEELADKNDKKTTRALFGLSFSSVHPKAGDAIFEFFWPLAIKAGWQRIYLGSPIPGFKRALSKQPGLCIESYVLKTTEGRQGVPFDPQLRYYHRRGFTEVVRVEEAYFPHPESMDYGVILRGDIPFSRFAPVLSKLPTKVLAKISKSFSI